VAGFAATDEAEHTEDDEAADGFTDGAGADADTAGEPGHGEVELEPAFETAVADEMRIDGAVGDGEMEAREETVLALYPEFFEIQFFAFHGGSLKRVFSCSFLVVGSEKKIQYREHPDPVPTGSGSSIGVNAVRGTMSTEAMTITGIWAGPKTKTPRRESGRTFLRIKVYHKNNQLSRQIIVEMVSTLDT
jgi:hypothetical protein